MSDVVSGPVFPEAVIEAGAYSIAEHYYDGASLDELARDDAALCERLSVAALEGAFAVRDENGVPEIMKAWLVQVSEWPVHPTDCPEPNYNTPAEACTHGGVPVYRIREEGGRRDPRQ